MTHLGRVFIEKLVKRFVKAGSASLLIGLFFILQYIFDMDFKCSCQSLFNWYDALYLFAPPTILTWVLLYIESFNQSRMCDISKKKYCSNFFSGFCRIVMKLFSVITIWITAVLFDGDWYVCYKTKSDSSHIGVTCKENDRLMDEEKQVIHHLKTQSLGIGLALLFCLFLVWTVAEVFVARRRSCDGQLCCPPYYKAVYEHLLAEQVSSYLNNELTQLATERAKDICQPYIQIIKDNVKNIDDNTIKVEDSWHVISASDFYMQQERREGGQEESREEELTHAPQNAETIALANMNTGPTSV